jgi:hypothetical protein
VDSLAIGHSVLRHLRKDLVEVVSGMLKFKRVAKDHGHSHGRTHHHDRVAYFGNRNKN